MKNLKIGNKNWFAAVLSIIPLFVAQLTYSQTFDSKNKETSRPAFEGYIVKYKSHPERNIFSALSIKKNKIISTSFGEFSILKNTENLSEENIKRIQSNPAVEYIEPNYIYQALENADQGAERTLPPEIKDANFKSQWGLNNTGTNNWFNLAAGIDLNAVNAWKLHSGSHQIKIAVVDSGMDYNHPDLKENVWTNEKELHGQAGVDDDQNGYVDDIHGYDFSNNDGDPMDDLGHGSQVAGLIGAAHNDIGIRGVMGSVQIMPIKFLSKGGGSTENGLKGIEYAIKNGAQIINLSWGGGEPSQALSDAILAAAAKNILVVAAAGNSKEDNDVKPLYPASYGHPNIISVASLSPNNKKSSFTNFGKNKVHVYAPGLYIVSTGLENSYDWTSGTSLSAPMVAGAAGLALSKNPKLTAVQVKEKIIQTSTQDPELLKFAQGGRVDLYELLKSIQ